MIQYTSIPFYFPCMIKLGKFFVTKQKTGKIRVVKYFV